MSLELRIEELTQAVRALTVAMTTANEVRAEAPTPKPRKTQASAPTPDVTAAAPVEAAQPAPAVASPSEAAPLVRFWHIEKHNTVYRQEADQPVPTIDGAVEITEAQYEKIKADLAARFPASAGIESASSAAPAAAPAVAAPTVASPTIKEVTEAFQALVKAKGPGAMKEILGQFGSTNISGLVDKGADLAQVMASVKAAA